MEKQQTAVEWLKELYSKRMLFAEDFEQAKQMEREQIINFHIESMKIGLSEEGDIEWTDLYLPKIKEIAEKHYIQTYGE